MNLWNQIYEKSLCEIGNKTGVPYMRASQSIIEIYLNNKQINIQQNLSDGIGSVVWDCVSFLKLFLSYNVNNIIKIEIIK